jgi:spore maturation protein CgeB
VDAALYMRTRPNTKFRSHLSYLGTYAADRQPKLIELLDLPARSLPKYHFLVAGPMYPADIVWPSNVHHLSHVPPQDHPAFYSSSRFALNLTRADMVQAGHSPSVRLFEASACGAAIISDRWAGIEDFLTPGEEILLASSRHDVIDYLSHLTEKEARRIGEAARQRILDQHSSDHRAREFESIADRVLRPSDQAVPSVAVSSRA